MNAGYSDRIAHALAFTAKYQATDQEQVRPAARLASANVAIILARHGADDDTIIAGILTTLLNEASPAPRSELVAKTAAKFGPGVAEILQQVIEPRYDARGKERSWEAIRVEHIAGLSQAGRRALEVAAAHEILLCGMVLTDARRLGPEYLTAHAPGGAPVLLGGLRDFVDMLTRHPAGPRPSLLAELRHLVERLETTLSDD